MTDDQKYPIGRFQRVETLAPAEREALIARIAAVPAALRHAVHGFTEAQFDTPYRDGGWTVRQVVHHVPDSHLNAYVRLKLALTEETPMIKPYAEDQWALLADTARTPVTTTLTLLEALHERWVVLWRALEPSAFARTLRHPENGLMTIDTLLALYAWHGDHHAAHVTKLRERSGW
jgi:hypothetical protein